MPASLEHAQEEDLERYSIGTLSVPQGEALEEHLLICHACQDRLAEVDAYVQTVRVAASRLRLETPLSHPRGGFWGLFSTARTGHCAVAAACLILGVWVSRSRPSASSSGLPPVAVLLRPSEARAEPSTPELPAASHSSCEPICPVSIRRPFGNWRSLTRGVCGYIGPPARPWRAGWRHGLRPASPQASIGCACTLRPRGANRCGSTRCGWTRPL